MADGILLATIVFIFPYYDETLRLSPPGDPFDILWKLATDIPGDLFWLLLEISGGEISAVGTSSLSKTCYGDSRRHVATRCRPAASRSPHRGYTQTWFGQVWRFASGTPELCRSYFSCPQSCCGYAGEPLRVFSETLWEYLLEIRCKYLGKCVAHFINPLRASPETYSSDTSCECLRYPLRIFGRVVAGSTGENLGYSRKKIMVCQSSSGDARMGLQTITNGLWIKWTNLHPSKKVYKVVIRLANYHIGVIISGPKKRSYSTLGGGQKIHLFPPVLPSAEALSMDLHRTCNVISIFTFSFTITFTFQFPHFPLPWLLFSFFSFQFPLPPFLNLFYL